MSEPQGEVRVRNVTTKRSDNFVGTAFEFGGGLVRLGLTVVTLPLSVLPRDTRQHFRNAARELLYAAATLPREFVDAASDAVETWAKETENDAPQKAPNDEIVAAS